MNGQHNKILDNSLLAKSMSINKLTNALITLNTLWGIKARNNKKLLQKRYKLVRRKKLLTRFKLLKKQRIKQQWLEMIKQQQLQALLTAQLSDQLKNETKYNNNLHDLLYPGI